MELEIITILMQKLDLILRHNFMFMLILQILFFFFLDINNGLIIQHFGCAIRTNPFKFTLPIAFVNNYHAVCSDIGSGCFTIAADYRLDLNSVTLYRSDGSSSTTSCSCICIGT